MIVRDGSGGVGEGCLVEESWAFLDELEDIGGEFFQGGSRLVSWMM